MNLETQKESPPLQNDLFRSPKITQTEIEQFNRDGFLIVQNFLNPSIIPSLLDRVDRVFHGEFETGVLPDKVKWQFGRDKDGIPRSLCNVWKADRWLARVLLAEEIGRVVSRLSGWTGARCNQDSLLWVPPKAGTIGFHQDNSYQDWHLPGDVVTCWISLGQTYADAGTLEYARGSHHWPLSARLKTFAAPENYREELDIAAREAGHKVELVPVVVPPGGAAFHQGRTWHGSNYNLSKESRYAIATHCMRADSRFHPTLKSPMFNHYKRFNDDSMDESFFPILWTIDGRRSTFLETYK